MYLFWRRLYEDYSRKTIFNSFFIIVISISVFSLVYSYAVAILIPNAWFWAAVLGFTTGLMIAVRRYETDLYLVFETLAPGVLFWVGIVSFALSLAIESIPSIVFSLLTLAVILMFLYLQKIYKRFTWYKSGKVGFAGMVAVAVYFIIRAVFALAASDVISLVGRMDAPISIALAFLLLFLMYNRE